MPRGVELGVDNEHIAHGLGVTAKVVTAVPFFEVRLPTALMVVAAVT